MSQPTAPPTSPSWGQPAPPPDWSAGAGRPFREIGGPGRRIPVIVLGVIGLVIGAVVAVVVVSYEISLQPPGQACNPCEECDGQGETCVTSAITMTATTGGTCQAFAPSEVSANTFNITIGGTTATTTTSNFGLSLTQAGATVSTAPGTSVASTGNTCAGGPTSYFPPSGGWVAILISPSGASVLAEYMGCGDNSPGWFTTSCGELASPVTILGGQSFEIVAPPAVSLTQATISVFGVGGTSITGQVTL